MQVRSPVVLSVDQGTTGTRAIIYGAGGKVLASAYQEFRQHYPVPGWVEHDALEILQTSSRVMGRALRDARIRPARVAAIGITNQRETTVMWDRQTGVPVGRAIVWQDRRTAPMCAALRERGAEPVFRRKTGLVLDPYFSGTKIAWMLRHIPGLRRRAVAGKILFGTIDAWLLWNLTGGVTHATDMTNASRTLLFDIHEKKWDRELMRLLDVPEALMPRVISSGEIAGTTSGAGDLPKGIPVAAILGDQQAALYGHGCYGMGEAKNTYGTGCFMMIHAGRKVPKVPHGLLATMACDIHGKPAYALEGAVFTAGAAIQWLRDGLKFFKRSRDSEALALKVRDTGGVVMIPALTGLGSPYWNPNVRGVIAGLTRGTRIEHVVRAALEAIAQQTADVFEKVENGSPFRLRTLRVDGGATENRFLMQFQADLLGVPVLVSDLAESTAWGVAKLAGHTVGLWADPEKLDRERRYFRYRPRMERSRATALRAAWKHQVRRLLSEF
ncbi:MAG: glycerol kinase GlpK [Candidatus Omnitrophota bacterium]|jgi:glycerol kinase